ncbi:helix-turn-helix domain-containing protein [Glutamicibacter sp. PS]|uniref:helix-turn-helix transcriptional regulator n=1 Tax=Glutamicibacter sp. PS TaxID=3075634 RepID=UPI00283EB4B1|nr:helix-turn-helix domain-containing protein [Glutamicibacter sp. PS]MDR4534996.1 helix-turn-helix domain-containing protein [Glutamicibacter sp. PS]
MSALEEIGLRIQQARKDNSLTQEQLAELAGISERTVRAIETATGNPSVNGLLAAASVLGLRLVVTE